MKESKVKYACETLSIPFCTKSIRISKAVLGI